MDALLDRAKQLLGKIAMTIEQTDRNTSGRLIKAWRRVETTDSIKIADIARAMEVLEETPTQYMPLVGAPAPWRPIQMPQAADPLRTARRVHLERYTEALAAVPSRAATSSLPVDKWGRPYLKIVNFSASTDDLVAEAVNRFYRSANCYPSVILLCRSRYAETVDSYFLTDFDVRIPYDCENSKEYDVLVRK